MTARRKRREEIAHRIAALEQRMRPKKDYSRDPVAYVRDVLEAKIITREQEMAFNLLLEYPYRVAIKSGHSIGKSWCAAAVINWRYDTFDPGVVISTAPTWQAVKDVLWTEVRLQRLAAGLGGFRGEMMPYLYSSPDHWAQGITANPAGAGAAFAGRHRANMCFVFDEAVGVKPIFYEVVETMFLPVEGNCLLYIYNPTDPSSRIYQEETATTLGGEPKYHVIQMSSLDHPNIFAELRGLPKPIPQAVGLEQVEGAIAEECDPIGAEDSEADLDLLWPPPECCPEGRTPILYRPSPIFESRWLGRWPSGAVFGVWSDRRFAAACKEKEWKPDLSILPAVGCDVARFGDDYSAFATRHGMVGLRLERHNGWDEIRVAHRCMELARGLADWLTEARKQPSAKPIDPQQIPINVDDVGVGGGVCTILRRNGYFVRECSAQTRTVFPDKYASLRDELWFGTVERARSGRLDWSRWTKPPGGGDEVLKRLRAEALAPTWEPTTSGQRKVESKKDMKKRLPNLGSPDLMDAVNLCFYDAPLDAPQAVGQSVHPLGEKPVEESGAKKRKWMGYS